MANEERKSNLVIPQWLAIAIMPALITVGGWLWAASSFTTKVNAATDGQAKLWQKSASLDQRMADNEKALAVVESQLGDIKAGQDEMRSDVKTLIRAIKI